MKIGRRTALKVAFIGAAVGLYNIMSSDEAGQVWERLEDGTVRRRPDLETGTEPQMVPSLNAARHTITPEQFGAVGDFDRTQYGKSGWTQYAADHNASEAFTHALYYAQQNPGTTIKLSGRYYIGSLSGEKQRQYGRKIYGPNTSLYALGTFAQPYYERMPVVGERIQDLLIHAEGAELYAGELTGKPGDPGPDTVLAFYQCQGISLTGTAKVRGFTPKQLLYNSENFALLRFGAGTRKWSVSEGWDLGAFLGDGVNVGGTRTEGGGTGAEHAAYDGRIDARIQERLGDGLRPWESLDPGDLAQRRYYQPEGVAHGKRSRLTVAVIHAQNVSIRSRQLYGGTDVEPNLDGQMAMDILHQGTVFPAYHILPLPVDADPWQEEVLVPAGTPGSSEVESRISYTSPARPQFGGGGIFDVQMERGYVYMHNDKIVPVDGLRFGAGRLMYGHTSADIGLSTSGGSVRNVSARTILPLSLKVDDAGNRAETSSLVVLSGNIRNTLFENISVEDARYQAIGLNPSTYDTAGNTEAGCAYINIKNLGLGEGDGKPLGFVPSSTSRVLSLQSVKAGVTVPVETTVQLGAGHRIDYAAHPSGRYAVYLTETVNFGGFNGAIPNGMRFILRASSAALQFMPNAQVVTQGGSVFRISGNEEVEFVWQAGLLYEVARRLSASPAIVAPAGSSDTDNAVKAILTLLQKHGWTA